MKPPFRLRIEDVKSWWLIVCGCQAGRTFVERLSLRRLVDALADDETRVDLIDNYYQVG